MAKLGKNKKENIVPTTKQMVCLHNVMKEVQAVLAGRKKKPDAMGKIMVKSGYSKKTAIAPSHQLLRKMGWERLMEAIGVQKIDSIILKWKKWSVDESDKEFAFKVGKELMKLSDLYPANKVKIGKLDERESVIEEI